MGKQKIIAIIRLLLDLHITFLQAFTIILFESEVPTNFYCKFKKIPKKKIDKQKFDKFMKRVTK